MPPALPKAHQEKVSGTKGGSVSAGGSSKENGNRPRTKVKPPNPPSTGNKATTPPGAEPQPLGDITRNAVNADDAAKRIQELEAALKAAEDKQAALEKQLSDTPAAESDDAEEQAEGNGGKQSRGSKDIAKIPRPQGKFSIQAAMGFGNSSKARQKYMSIVRVVKELLGNARINWEVEWADVAVGDRAKFYDVVRAAIPEMAKYTNDWATEAIAKQYVKNKRSYAYGKGWLVRKDKYAYLKDNAAKRTDAPRGNGKRKATAQNSSRPAKKTRIAKASSKVKGKATATASNDSEEEEEGAGHHKDSDGSESEED